MVLEIPVGSRKSQTRNTNYAQADSLFVRHFICILYENIQATRLVRLSQRELGTNLQGIVLGIRATWGIHSFTLRSSLGAE